MAKLTPPSESDLKIFKLELEITSLKKRLETMSKENTELKSRFSHLIELAIRKCP